MSWRDYLKKKSQYYKKQNENRESSSSELSKGIIYVNTTPNEVLEFFLIPNPEDGSLTVTRGIHWMQKGKASVRCPIFTRKDGLYLPDPYNNENILDATRRAFDDEGGPRCAWCELHLAALQLDNEKVLDGTFGSKLGSNRSVSLRVDFFVIPLIKLREELPDCFGEEPDWDSSECQSCPFIKECYLKGPAINILEKTQGVEQQLLVLLEDFEKEMGEDVDPFDLENAYMFKLHHTKRKGNKTEYTLSMSQKTYNMAQMFEDQFGEVIYAVIEDTWPKDDDLFSPSHTYAEMVSDMRPHERKCLFAFLKEEGRDAPGLDLSDVDEEDDDKPRRPRRADRTKIRRKRADVSDDDSADEKPKLRRRRPLRTRDDEDDSIPEEKDFGKRESDEDEEEKPKRRLRRRLRK